MDAVETLETQTYRRRVTPIESLFMRSPYAIVAAVARIRGEVTEGMLRSAADRVQTRHPNLRVRLEEDEHQASWFTSDGAGEIQIESMPRVSGDQWMEVVGAASSIPFEFEKSPPIRFILVQSPEVSDLVIFCHHIICDGMSLAFLVRDLMRQLGDPQHEVEVLPDPSPIDFDTVPEGISVGRVARFFINRINKSWEKERVTFDQEDYEAINEAYWKNLPHQLLSIELSEDETTALVDRCRREGVTVNSALITAFIGAQAMLKMDSKASKKIATAGSLRDRVVPPAGEVMGFYAGAVNLEFQYDTGIEFWDNARKLHQKLKPLINDKELFEELLTWCYLDPTILHAIPFKLLGGLTADDSPRRQKLVDFHQREDTVYSILKRDKLETLDRVSIGTAVTNLTRLDFPTRYGPLELERMIMKPGGAFPLTTVMFTLGVVTCSGKLSMLAEYIEKNLTTETMHNIRDQALSLLGLGE